MPTRLHTRLALGHIVVIATVFLVLGLYLTGYVRDLQQDNLISQLESEAWLIADAAEPAIADQTSTSAQALADRLRTPIAARITIIATDGTVLGDSDVDIATLGNHGDRPEVAAALNGQVGLSERWSNTLGYDVLNVAVPVMQDGNITGVVRLAIAYDQIAQPLQSVALVLIIALVAAAVATALVSALISQIFIRPLADLLSVTQRVSQGDLNARALVDDEGEVGELADAFNEMASELQTTIYAIDEERARLETIVEHLADGILIIGPDDATVLINRTAERLLGVHRQRAIGHTYPEVLRDYELVELVRQSKQTDQNAGRVPSAFVTLGRPRRSVQAFVYPIPSAHTPLAVVILRDITELRRTEAIRRDFVANVSHDLRTPISSLKALAETLLDGALEDEEVARDFLGRMGVEVDNLARLVEELLELSRAESGQISLQTEEGDIGAVIRHSAERLRAQAQIKNIDIQLDLPKGLPVIRFDSNRIEQVLVNLLHNAVKFTPPNGTVTIGVEEGESALTIFVSDTGEGIEDTDIERIFERFYKTDRSRSATGSGLGLAIAKHLIQLHGGRIWAESNYGAGATFKFALPLGRNQNAMPAHQATPG